MSISSTLTLIKIFGYRLRKNIIYAASLFIVVSIVMMAAGLNPDLVACFRMETANTPIPGDSTLWVSQLEKSPAPATPSVNPSSDYYIELYDTADSRIGQYLPQ